MKPELSQLQQLAVSQHAICLSQVNIESYEHSRHTNTSLQNTLPTMPFSKHLCLWPNTLPCHLQLDFFKVKTQVFCVCMCVHAHVLTRML